jgi:hypothetical protein
VCVCVRARVRIGGSIANNRRSSLVLCYIYICVCVVCVCDGERERGVMCVQSNPPINFAPFTNTWLTD